jgi:hypothetical protein
MVLGIGEAGGPVHEVPGKGSSAERGGIAGSAFYSEGWAKTTECMVCDEKPA